MNPKPPTPQGISALLRKAGFPRSNYGDKGVMWHEATPGFKAWKTYHKDHPDQPYVAVQHVADRARFGPGEDEERAYVRECRKRLEEYAAVVREAGWAALIRYRGSEPPWLTILTVVNGD